MIHFSENDLRFQHYLDGRLTAEERSAVEQHLAECPECASLCREYQRLDRRLARAIRHPALSPGFHARILRQLETDSNAPTTAEKRRQLEAELQAEWEAQRRFFFRTQLPGFLDALGYSTAAAVGGSLLFRLIMVLLQVSGTATSNPAQLLALGLGAATGAVILLAGVAFGARAQLSRWLSYF